MKKRTMVWNGKKLTARVNFVTKTTWQPNCEFANKNFSDSLEEARANIKANLGESAVPYQRRIEKGHNEINEMWQTVGLPVNQIAELTVHADRYPICEAIFSEMGGPLNFDEEKEIRAREDRALEREFGPVFSRMSDAEQAANEALPVLLGYIKSKIKEVA